MILFVDKVEKFELGGFTIDKRKAEYNLSLGKISFEKILSEAKNTTEIPSGMFNCGQYIIAFNISRDLKNINVGVINHKIDLDKYFDIFADCLSPKAVAGFHTLKQEIINKEKITKLEISDDDSDFEIAYQNYIDYRNRLN